MSDTKFDEALRELCDYNDVSLKEVKLVVENYIYNLAEKYSDETRRLCEYVDRMTEKTRQNVIEEGERINSFYKELDADRRKIDSVMLEQNRKTQIAIVAATLMQDPRHNMYTAMEQAKSLYELA